MQDYRNEWTISWEVMGFPLYVSDTYLQVILSSILLNDIRGKVQSQQGKAFPATGNMHAIRSSAFIITIHTYGTESQYGPVSQKVTDFSLLVSDVHLQSMISSLPFNNPTIKDG